MSGPGAVRRAARRLRPGRRRTDEDILRAAYRDHGGEVFRLALRSLGDRGLAEDVVQETFARAWQSRERFDAGRGSRRTWLFAIARNLVVDAARKRATRPPGPLADEPGDGEANPATGAEDPTERTLTEMQMSEALERLSEDHRQVILEVYYRGRPYGEVAGELGVPAGTLRSRTYYALKALRLALQEMGWSDERS